MTDALGTTVPAGWYPDPWGSTSQRWWDGTSWSANLYPQPQATAPDASMPAIPVTEDEGYVPGAVRSTFEPASSYRTAAPPTVGSPFLSRRAMRELAHAEAEDDVSVATEDASMNESTPGHAPIAETLPAYTQAPEFSPEPTAAVPPPVWTEPEKSAPPVESPEAAEPVLPLPPVEPPREEHAPAASVAAPITSFPSTPAVADDGWAASLSRWEDVQASSAPPDALPIFGDAPPVSYSQRAVRYQPLHGRTSAVWLIVFMPFLQAAATMGSVFLFPGLVAVQDLTPFTPVEVMMPMLLSMRDWILFALLPLSIAFFIFTLIMGFQDRSRLRLLGHEQTASPWWLMLHTLAYLIVRSVRVRQCTGRRGAIPLTTYVCLYFAPAIGIVVAGAVTNALYGAIPS